MKFSQVPINEIFSFILEAGELSWPCVKLSETTYTLYTFDDPPDEDIQIYTIDNPNDKVEMESSS